MCSQYPWIISGRVWGTLWQRETAALIFRPCGFSYEGLPSASWRAYPCLPQCSTRKRA